MDKLTGHISKSVLFEKFTKKNDFELTNEAKKRLWTNERSKDKQVWNYFYKIYYYYYYYVGVSE
jgi:hypothetical protein